MSIDPSTLTAALAQVGTNTGVAQALRELANDEGSGPSGPITAAQVSAVDTSPLLGSTNVQGQLNALKTLTGGGAVTFDPVTLKTNVRTTRTAQSPILNTKTGITNLGSRSTGASAGATGNYATISGGDQNSATSDDATVVGGVQGTASASGATVLGGHQNTASGLDSAVGGTGSTATGSQCFAYGNACEADGTGSTATGDSCIATGDGASASGQGCQALDDGATASGLSNVAAGQGSTALGNNNNAPGSSSTAIGFANLAQGSMDVALGNACTTNGSGALAAGVICGSTGQGSAAIGSHCTASGTGGVSVGSGNLTDGGNGGFSSGVTTHAANNAASTFGTQSKATRPTQWAHASGAFAVLGDAQTSLVVVRGQTPGATGTETTGLFTSAATASPPAYFTLEDGKAYTLSLTLIATSATDTLSLTQRVCVRQDAGVLVIVATGAAEKIGSAVGLTWSLAYAAMPAVPASGIPTYVGFNFTTGAVAAHVSIAADLRFVETTHP